MQERFSARLKMIAAVCFFHFLPWMALAIYTGWMLAPAERWTFLSLALCAVLLATLLLIICMRQFESALEVIFSETDTYQNDVSDSERSAEKPSLEAPYAILYEEALQQLKTQEADCKELKELINRQEQEHIELQRSSQEEKAAMSEELEDERLRAENFQKQVIQLETNARDLKYEIKALIDSTGQVSSRSVDMQVDLESISSFTVKPLNTLLDPISTLSSAESQLTLCVDIAQKFTGARHLTRSLFRLQDASVEGYDLDLRRLSDTLLSVTGRPFFLYHQRDKKLLFLSPPIKQLLGWNAEKYLQDFSALFPEGQEEWDEQLRQLPLLGTLELNKKLVTSAGDSLPITFHLGWIPTGIFKAHVVGVMEKVPQFVS